MATNDPWATLTPLRQTLAGARNDLIAALDALEQAKLALADAQRRQADTSKEEGDVGTASTNLIGARTAEFNARKALNDQIGLWLPSATTVEADLARLPADSPVVFLPVRIETRFGKDATKNNQPALFVRIYPDEIFLNVHETALTREEYQAGVDYYNAVNQTVNNGTFDELPAWRQIVQLMSPQRAAYVLRRLAPDLDANSEVTFANYSQPLPFLNFPKGILFKSGSISRPAEAILPDRWVVLATRGSSTTRAVGNLIPEPMIMSPDPSADPKTFVDVPGSNGKLKIDPRMLWTVDYQTAFNQGMAVTVPLSSTDATQGFDRVIVFGVKTSMSPADTSNVIEQLMDAHHYTRGLSIVPQGTPTNNTEGAPTPVSKKSRDPEIDFHIERDRPPTDHTKALWMLSNRDDGDFLARLLGVPNGTFLDVEGARAPGRKIGDNFPADGGGPGREQQRAAAMNDALWPVLFGHFTQQMLHFTLDQQAAARDYFVNLVRARGPAPAFRIGDVPYGVLPALSVVRWGARSWPFGGDSHQDLELAMVDAVRRLREKWKVAAQKQTARVTRTSTDPGADLMRVLALQPSAQQARVRTTRGQALHFNLAQFFSFDYQTTANRVSEIVTGVFQGAGVSSWLGLPVASLIFEPLVSRYTPFLVAPPVQLSETAPLSGAFDCLTPLVNATSTTALINDAVLPAGTVKTLFYKLLRHALLLEMIDVMVRTSRAIQNAHTPPLTIPFAIPFVEPELRAIHGSPNVATPADSLTSNVPEIVTQIVGNVTPPPGSTQLSVGDFLLAPIPSGFNYGHQVSVFKQHLALFQQTPAAELERLFTETLDLASHRLDAWITAFATRRVLEERGTHLNSRGSAGDYLGGYAFVEDLRPVARTPDPLPDGTIGEKQLGNGGFIQAPSMTHAAAAGLLRNGHLTNSTEPGQAGQKCAVDLSSARVRAAMLVLDELRAGQTLGAILGYRFERRLHDLNQGLDAYRFTLRNRFPLVANKQGTPATDPVAAIAATNVVDGLALWKAFQSGALPLGAPDLTPAQVPFVQKELQNLGDLIDGVADLTTSESVLHLVRGNVAAGAANLDALPTGSHPPEPEMAHSVLRGRGLTYRVALLMQDATAAASWPPPPPPPTPPPQPTDPPVLSPRATVDPVLDRWLAAQLGDPTNVRCSVDVQITVIAPDGTKTTTTVTRIVTLSQLRFQQVALQGVLISGSSITATGTTSADRALRPLDVLALARAVAQSNQGSLLDRWIKRVALQADNEQVVKIHYDRVNPNDADERTFPELFELAQAVGELLAGARPLEPSDLVSPGELPNQDEALAQSLEDGANALDAAADAAVLAALEAKFVVDQAQAGAIDPRGALENAAAFVPSAYPVPAVETDDLTPALQAVSGELGRRFAAAQEADTSIAASGSRGVVARALFKLQAVFGPDFVALPTFEPVGGAELKQSFDSIAAGLAGEPRPLRSAPVKRLQQMAQVREPMGRWRRLSMYTRAVRGLARPRLDVAQLPHVPGERWAGLPFDVTAGQTPPERGRVSTMVYSYGSAAPDGGPGKLWSGILIDQWTEMLPDPQEETGIALHYDAPGAEAPQVVLVVPPSSAASAADTWQAADIIATLGETMDLAKIRTVDSEMVDTGHLAPTIYLPQNVKRPTAATGWIGELAAAIAGLRAS